MVDEGSFTLLSHLEENMTDEESIEKIAQHFAQISQEFPPLNINLLTDEVRLKPQETNKDQDIPDIQEYKVYEKIRESKKPKSSVPGDLPRRLVKEFGPELATPATLIYRNIVRKGH